MCTLQWQPSSQLQRLLHLQRPAEEDISTAQKKIQRQTSSSPPTTTTHCCTHLHHRTQTFHHPTPYHLCIPKCYCPQIFPIHTPTCRRLPTTASAHARAATTTATHRYARTERHDERTHGSNGYYIKPINNPRLKTKLNGYLPTYNTVERERTRPTHRRTKNILTPPKCGRNANLRNALHCTKLYTYTTLLHIRYTTP